MNRPRKNIWDGSRWTGSRRITRIEAVAYTDWEEDWGVEKEYANLKKNRHRRLALFLDGQVTFFSSLTIFLSLSGSLFLSFDLFRSWVYTPFSSHAPDSENSIRDRLLHANSMNFYLQRFYPRPDDFFSFGPTNWNQKFFILFIPFFMFFFSKNQVDRFSNRGSLDFRNFSFTLDNRTKKK